MRLFGSERVMGMMEKLGVDEDTPIDAKILSDAIENAQKSVESRNFQTRKNVLQYDDVMNTQREVIYKQRRQVLDGEDLQASIQTMLHSMVENAIHGHMGEQKHMDAEAFREAVAPFRAMFLKPGELELTDEELAKKQLCEVIAKLRLSHLFPYDNTTVRSLAFSHLVRFSPCFGLSLRLVRRSGEAVGRGAAASPLHRPFPSTRRQQRTSPRPLSRRWRTRRSRQRSRSSTVF